MEFHGIDEFMVYLKTQFDRSGRRQDWRALTGRDHVTSAYDTFIVTDEKVFQVKAKEFAPGRMASVAREVGDSSPDLLELVKGGASVPLNVISHTPSAQSVIMFGIQQYSSEVSDLLRREYYSSRQDRLESDLDRSLNALLERPEYRRAYRDLRDSQEGYFA